MDHFLFFFHRKYKLDLLKPVVRLTLQEFRLGIDFYNFVAGKANFISIVNGLQFLDLSRLWSEVLPYSSAHYALNDSLCVLLFEQIFENRVI